MLTRRLEDLTLADIERLKENGITESNYLDFKSAPVGNSDRERKEFLADVTAFANAAGGDIVFGVTEKDGAAAEVPGIALPDSDKEKLRLGSLIRECPLSRGWPTSGCYGCRLAMTLACSYFGLREVGSHLIE